MNNNTNKWRKILSEVYRNEGPSAYDTWMGEFTDTDIATNAEHIREICDLIVKEFEGAPEQSDVYRRVANMFEQHAGGLMRDLQTYAFEELGLNDPLGD